MAFLPQAPDQFLMMGCSILSGVTRLSLPERLETYLGNTLFQDKRFFWLFKIWVKICCLTFGMSFVPQLPYISVFCCSFQFTQRGDAQLIANTCLRTYSGREANSTWQKRKRFINHLMQTLALLQSKCSQLSNIIQAKWHQLTTPTLPLCVRHYIRFLSFTTMRY